MEQYTFEVLAGDREVAIERAVPIPNERAMWSRIGSIAKGVGQSGRLIRVTNAAGKIVVLVGAATALRLCVEVLEVLPPF